MPTRFQSEEERLTHPQAKLISEELWSSPFNQELTEKQLDYLQKPLSELTPPADASIADWICILIANLEENKDGLQALIHGLNNSNPLIACAMLGQHEFLCLVSENELSFDIFYECLIASFEHNQPVTFNYLYSKSDDLNEIIAYKSYKLFRMAAAYNQLELMEVLLKDCDQKKLSNMILAKDNAAIESLIDLAENSEDCEKASTLLLTLIKHVEKWKLELTYTQSLLSDLLFFAVTNNNHAIFDYCNQLVPKQVTGWINDRCAYVLAAAGGHTDMMDKIARLFGIGGYTELDAFFHAAKYGRLTVINKLVNHSRLNKVERFLSYNFKDNNAFYEAAANGHHSVMERLLELGESKVTMIVANNYQLFHLSKVTSDFIIKELLSILKENAILKEHHSFYFESALKVTFEHAILQEKFDILTMLNETFTDEMKSITPSVFRHVSEKGLTQKVRDWFYNYIPKKQYFYSLNDYFIIREAAGDNQFVLVDEYLRAMPPELVKKVLSSVDFSIFRSALRHRQFSEIEKYLSYPSLAAALICNNYETVQVTAEAGQLALFQLMLEKVSPIKALTANGYAAFLKALENKHYEVAKHCLDVLGEKALPMLLGNLKSIFCCSSPSLLERMLLTLQEDKKALTEAISIAVTYALKEENAEDALTIIQKHYPSEFLNFLHTSDFKKNVSFVVLENLRWLTTYYKPILTPLFIDIDNQLKTMVDKKRYQEMAYLFEQYPDVVTTSIAADNTCHFFKALIYDDDPQVDLILQTLQLCTAEQRESLSEKRDCLLFALRRKSSEIATLFNFLLTMPTVFDTLEAL